MQKAMFGPVRNKIVVVNLKHSRKGMQNTGHPPQYTRVHFMAHSKSETATPQVLWSAYTECNLIGGAYITQRFV